MDLELQKIIEQLIKEAIEEMNAISGGGGAVEPSGQISGTGGNPLGRDMTDQYETMWSGDEPEDKKKKSLKEEALEEEELDEISVVGSGAVAGYALPLGMKPDYDTMGTKGKGKKRPRRWYDVNKENMYESNLQTLLSEIMTEAAKGPEDLPDGVSIVVSGGLLGGTEVAFAPNDKGITGSVSIMPARSGCRGANIITHTKATKGYGPLLYDLAIELAGNAGVAPDRDSVSSDASNVWKYYYENRPDILHQPLDDIDNPKTPPKEDDCSFDSSRSEGSISVLDDSGVKRPWLNFVYYAQGTPKLSALQTLDKVVVEGVVPQGSASDRPLHGAPVYFHPTGRSLPSKFSDGPKDRSKKGKKKRKSSEQARAWNAHEGLLDTEKLETKQKKKKKWYQKETAHEMDQKGIRLPLEVFRQDSAWSIKLDEKLSREKSSRRTEQNSRRRRIGEEKISLKKVFFENASAGTIFYHGTNQEFAPGDLIQPPLVTGNISEKGRKKNLDKVFVTLDKGSAKIYAGRAKQANGGAAYVYQVEPLGAIEWLNRTPGTTVLMIDAARVIHKV